MARPEDRNKPTPTPQPKPHDDCPDGYETCHVNLNGYVYCPKPCPPRICNRYLKLPCNVEGEDLPTKIMQWQAQPGNFDYHIVQVIDHGHDGWTIIFEGPCCD